MGSLVRILNDKGIETFREYLDALRSGTTQKPPVDLLEDAWSSAKLHVEIEIENMSFKNRFEAAKYLFDKLRPLDTSKIERNIGLWTWLSLKYFNQVCPFNKNKKRSPGQDYRHILDTDSRLYYRHLLMGPYTVYRLHGSEAPLLLYGALFQMTEAYREIACRQAFITNSGIVSAANSLYYDIKKRRPKRGFADKVKKPGSLRRYIDVIQQLDLTYDLYSLSGEEILDLLPPEFDEWKE
jgi:hypothetical protein